MEWRKALGYGLRFFIMSVMFTLIGLSMIASALSINLGIDEEGQYMISVNTVEVFRNLGAFTLFALGIMIVVVGNAASFFKLLSEIVNDSRKDYLW